MIALEYDGSLTDTQAVAEALPASGLSSAACTAKALLLARAAAALGPSAEARPMAYFVPGRIEVLGKHTDYAGGSSLVAASERGVCLVATARDDRQTRVVDALSGQRAEFVLDGQLEPTVGHWSNYPMTVARRLARNFAGSLRGAEIAIASDLPPAAGMSSSSALIVGIFLALADVNRLEETAEYRENIGSAVELAGYAATIENGQSFGTLRGDRGVGTFGGSEDHTALLCAEAGQVVQYAYCPARRQRSIAVPPEWGFVIASSGVVAEKTGAARQKYNAAAESARALAELWRAQTQQDHPHLAAVLDSAPDAAVRLEALIERSTTDAVEVEALQRRLAHFLIENEQVIPAAGDALARGDAEAFGRQVDTSQAAAEQLLGNQVPATAALAAAARRLGAIAASGFGGGFGGSVWALVRRDDAEPFMTAWHDVYSREFPDLDERSEFFSTAAGPAAFRVA